jgi:hypothetical protein
MRIFIVVAKNRPELFHYFSAGFAGMDGIEVIVDRRIGADDPVPTALATQFGDRRARRDIYDELQERGFVIVRLPA